MKFNIDKKDKYVLISTTIEKLDAQHAPELKSELVFLSKNGVKNIIINLEQTRYCDSSGLSALLVANRLCKDSEGAFVLTGLQPSVEKLISISQLTNVLNITPTVNEAIDIIFMEEVGRDVEDDS